MQYFLFSSSLETLEKFKERFQLSSTVECYDTECFEFKYSNDTQSIFIVDYDSVSSDLNKLIAANRLPQRTIVLERAPEILTGKFLVTHGVKAYGNAMMHPNHFQEMLQAVQNGKIWTYPALTAALTAEQIEQLSPSALEFLHKRLSEKEIEVVKLVMQGFTNDAIASTLEISVRTVKAHMGSIFTKLHVNDRLSLVLLLK